MSFINTADILGDQEVLDRLVSDTLTELNDDRLVKMRSYGLYNKIALEQINFPNLISLNGSNQFTNCYNLENISLEKLITPTYYLLGHCYNLKTINMPNITIISQNMFYQCYYITNYLFNKITSINNASFSSNGMKEITLYDLSYLAANAFNECGFLNKIELMSTTKNLTLYNSFTYSNLTHLIIHYPDSVLTLDANVLNNTPISKGYGAIYVPSNLVNDYKSATNWSVYANQIYSLEDYPVTINLGDTINDSWETIFNNEEQHQHTNLYALGDTKTMMYGELPILMQIVYMDEDKIGWLSKNTMFSLPVSIDLGQGHKDWEHCFLREYLNNVVYNNIETTVKNKILSVENTYYDGSTTKTCSDKIFIPSYREMFGGDTRENSGNLFTTFFNDAESRKKEYNCNSIITNWALRSRYNPNTSTNYFSCVNTNGAIANSASSHIAIAFYT